MNKANKIKLNINTHDYDFECMNCDAVFYITEGEEMEKHQENHIKRGNINPQLTGFWQVGVRFNKD